MGRPKDSGRVDLARVFDHVQRQMIAQLSVGGMFEHPTACGAATEHPWLELLNRYLPQRYRASSAFIVDAAGRRSRQIDIAVYDHFYSPLLFHHASGGLHVPAESVYAVLEVKKTLTAQLLHDAARQAASVRALRRTSAPVLSAGKRRPPLPAPPILAGVVAGNVAWRTRWQQRLSTLLTRLPPTHRLDLGCILLSGSFEVHPGARRVRFSPPRRALLFFLLRLLSRLQQMGTAPAVDLDAYARALQIHRRAS